MQPNRFITQGATESLIEHIRSERMGLPLLDQGSPRNESKGERVERKRIERERELITPDHVSIFLEEYRAAVEANTVDLTLPDDPEPDNEEDLLLEEAIFGKRRPISGEVKADEECVDETEHVELLEEKASSLEPIRFDDYVW